MYLVAFPTHADGHPRQTIIAKKSATTIAPYRAWKMRSGCQNSQERTQEVRSFFGKAETGSLIIPDPSGRYGPVADVYVVAIGLVSQQPGWADPGPLRDRGKPAYSHCENANRLSFRCSVNTAGPVFSWMPFHQIAGPFPQPMRTLQVFGLGQSRQLVTITTILSACHSPN